MTIIVYTAPACMPCKFTKRALQRHGIAFEERDGQAPDAADKLREMGYRELPVVLLSDNISGWSGYRPDLIAALQYDGSIDGPVP